MSECILLFVSRPEAHAGPQLRVRPARNHRLFLWYLYVSIPRGRVRPDLVATDTSILLGGEFNSAYLESYLKAYAWGFALVLGVNMLIFPHSSEHELRGLLVSSLHHISTLSHLIAKVGLIVFDPRQILMRAVDLRPRDYRGGESGSRRPQSMHSSRLRLPLSEARPDLP